MNRQERKPSEIIEEFICFLETSKSVYLSSCDVVIDADDRLQDMLHELEFAKNKSEKGKAATKLKRSRNNRRISKDKATEYKNIAEFIDSSDGKLLSKKLRELMRKQKFTEEYLDSERIYKPRKGDNAHANPD